MDCRFGLTTPIRGLCAGEPVTIAVCYLSPEGVVLGADSTSTVAGGAGNHYFNHAQKVFEVGEGTTFGIVTWGLGGLGSLSYRTLIALLGDDLRSSVPASVQDVAQRFVEVVWPHYQAFDPVQRFQVLHGMATRTADEDAEYQQLSVELVAGFCVAGHCESDRISKAYEIVFDPLQAKPSPTEIQALSHRWWGVPNIIQRMIFGGDSNLHAAIMASGSWTGSDIDLWNVFKQQALNHPILPIREAIDFVHTCIRSTGKAMRFSEFPQVCGGPPEIAVVTTDRKFRWVRHKLWDTAIEDGG